MTLRDELKNLVRFRCASPTKRRSGEGIERGAGSRPPPFAFHGHFFDFDEIH